MNESYEAQAPSERIAASVKTAVLVVVLGLIALVADVSLVSPHEVPLAGPTSVPAGAAANNAAPRFPTLVEMPMIAWDRPAAYRPPNRDPSVPPAESVAPSKVEPQPAAF